VVKEEISLSTPLSVTRSLKIIFEEDHPVLAHNTRDFQYGRGNKVAIYIFLETQAFVSQQAFGVNASERFLENFHEKTSLLTDLRMRGGR
jgi:hypothetical protein